MLDRITREIASAMKSHDAPRLGALRMLKAALMNREVEKGRALDDRESQQVVTTLVKQRRESIEMFQKAGRDDLVNKESAEVTILEGFLPPPVSEDELTQTVDKVATELGATSPKDMGRVMKGVMAQLEGQRVDGKVVSELVRRRLGS